MNKLGTAIRKLDNLDGLEAGFYYNSITGHYPENEWFAPNNKGTQHFTICDHLSQAGLICRKETPIIKDGRFAGKKIEFKYNKELNY